MAWYDELPLKYTDRDTKSALRLLKRGIDDPDYLREICKLAGLSVGMINFNKAPSLLFMPVLDRASKQGRVKEFLAEVLVSEATAGIHDDLWALLGDDAGPIHEAALATQADFERLAQLPSPTEFSVNAEAGKLERIVSLLARFSDPAEFRYDLAQCEARVMRLEIDGKGEGTGWLVGPDLVLTALHVVSKANGEWGRVKARLDYKQVPTMKGKLLAPGRLVGLADNALLASSKNAGGNVEFSESGAESNHLDFALIRLAESVGTQGLGPGGAGDEPRGHFELPTGTYDFQPDDGLFVLGHPALQGAGEAGPLKMTLALPCSARLTQNGSRVRYSVNTEGGNSGSPVMDQDLNPVALHHAGSRGQPSWDAEGHWPGGFNQGIPLNLIVAAIREQADSETVAALGL